MEMYELRRLVEQGEGLQLEFKRKANHPDKIVREMVAFANTQGGILLLGVDDDKSIYGCKFPEEQIYLMTESIKKYCLPELPYQLETLAITSKRSVLIFHIQEGKQKPYYAREQKENGELGRKKAYIRSADMSMMASREMYELLRYANTKKGVRFEFGAEEQRVLQLLESHPRMSLINIHQAIKLRRRRQTSNLLITLVRAGLLSLHPSEKGDFYSLAEDAFQ